MSLFTDKAPPIMVTLMTDFGLTKVEAAAILGNIGHECGGFQLFQEQKPSVPGSKGGFGWCQWTGSRRTAFEAYCKRNDLDPKSDRANYGWLFTELRGSEKAAIPALKAATGLYNKVVAFEAKFERAGVKHYEYRHDYAVAALAAYEVLEKTGKLKPLFPVLPPLLPPPLPDDPGDNAEDAIDEFNVPLDASTPVTIGKKTLTIGAVLAVIAGALAKAFGLI